MNDLICLNSPDDIPRIYQDSPIADLIAYHNFKVTHKDYEVAQVLIGMCMDYRKQLNIPRNFAYVLRKAGANLNGEEFAISFAIAVGKISAIALIGHTECRMVGVNDSREAFVQGLVERGGCEAGEAEAEFDAYAPKFVIQNEIQFVSEEAKRLRLKYPKVLIAPLLFDVRDQRIYAIEE